MRSFTRLSWSKNTTHQYTQTLVSEGTAHLMTLSRAAWWLISFLHLHLFLLSAVRTPGDSWDAYTKENRSTLVTFRGSGFWSFPAQVLELSAIALKKMKQELLFLEDGYLSLCPPCSEANLFQHLSQLMSPQTTQTSGFFLKLILFMRLIPTHSLVPGTTFSFTLFDCATWEQWRCKKISL